MRLERGDERAVRPVLAEASGCSELHDRVGIQN
jgi:hypothetical protein